MKHSLISSSLAMSILLLLSTSASHATTDNFPDKPVHLIVGFGAGGGTDVVARAIAKQLSLELGQSVVVENRPGAGGSIGASYVARAKPDGYTLLFTSASSVTISPAINPKLDYTQSDFTPVAQVTTAPLLLAVNKDLGIRSVSDLIARTKENPGALNFASSGLGSGPHLAGVYFQQEADVDLTHVPYKSGAASVTSVLAGDTQVTFATTPTSLGLIRSGELVGLAVTTREATALVPELEGMAQAGLPGYEIFQWNGVFAPANTPQDVVEKLFTAIESAMMNEEVQKNIQSAGTDVKVSASPAAFSEFLQENNKFWRDLVKSSGAIIN
ncbi:Bug family tripartite tricarboxylate transporter substrate binding protein [Orrella marina]|nr:tripartite tricarboxylate transporter substrate binding protein [Orrella marina]